MIRQLTCYIRKRGLQGFVSFTVIAVLFLFVYENDNRYPIDNLAHTFPAANRIDDTIALEDLIDNTTINFEGFNNVTGANEYIIPNIVHFIRFNQSEFTFIDYIVLKAVMRNHKPDKILYHTDIPDIPWTGKYWNWVRADRDLVSRIQMLPLDAPEEVFGQPLSEPWRFFHGSDLGRIDILMKYGGIYLDRDVYVIRNLNKYRNYEFVLNWAEEDEYLGTQVLMAHKDARFLRRWLDTYKEYHPDRWYYNAGERPTIEILHPHPELIHRVNGNFGAGFLTSMELYKNPDFDWRKLDAIHLLINHRQYMDKQYNKTPHFNEVNIQKYEYPFGELAREIMNIS